MWTRPWAPRNEAVLAPSAMRTPGRCCAMLWHGFGCQAWNKWGENYGCNPGRRQAADVIRWWEKINHDQKFFFPTKLPLIRLFYHRSRHETKASGSDRNLALDRPASPDICLLLSWEANQTYGFAWSIFFPNVCILWKSVQGVEERDDLQRQVCRQTIQAS